MHCSLHGSCNTQTFSLSQRNHAGYCRCQVPESSRRVHTPRCSTELVAPLSNVVLTQLDQLPAPAIAAEVSTQHGEVSRVGRTLSQPQEPQPAHDRQQQSCSAASQPASAIQNQIQRQAAGFDSQQQQQQQQVLQEQMQHPQQQVLQQAAAVQPEQAASPQLQQPDKQLAQSSGRGSRKAKARAAAAASAPAPQMSTALQEPQQEPQKPARSHRRLHTQAPLKFNPCGRGGTLKHAAAVSKHLSQGKQVLLPAGSGMQVARGVAALASARTLLLGCSSSTGLAFQPSFPAAVAAEVQEVWQAQQQQQQQQQVLELQQDHQQQQQQQQQQEQQQGLRQQDGQSSGKPPVTSDSDIMMFVAGLPEAQLRRFEQSPLIAARYGDPGTLAGAAFARVCQQGFTAMRAAGPNPLAVALAAVTHARRKLLGCGLDIAVVPMTEFVDVDSLAGQDGQSSADCDGDEQQLVDYGPDDELGRQCVRVTVLHLMRCQPQQPWQLLPWPPAPEQQPAVLWQAEQLERQQREWLLQQQQQQYSGSAKDSVRLQLNGAARQAAKAGGSAGAAASAVVMPPVSPTSPASNGQAGLLELASGSRSCGNGRSTAVSRVWPDTAVEGVTRGEEADMLMQEASYSHVQGMAPRQGASVLLQKQRKSKRQLVAAAQSTAHGNKGSCSSDGSSAG